MHDKMVFECEENREAGDSEEGQSMYSGEKLVRKITGRENGLLESKGKYMGYLPLGNLERTDSAC